MSNAMFLVLPMVYLVTRLFAKKVYLTEGLSVEEYRVRKENVNVFLAKTLLMGVSLILLHIVMKIVISVALFLAPYIFTFFAVLILLSFIENFGEGLLIIRYPFLFL